MSESSSPPVEKPAFPAGMHNVFAFATFNALSFPLIVSSPMVLYAKTLGATATVLGVIAGMMPLLVIFQIPAAKHVTRIGYKRFVYAGWGTRVMFIFAMALVPVTGGFLNTTTRLVLMLMLLFAFNLSRGISSCAWLPWITSLIHPGMRGKYLATEAACVNLSSFTVFLLAAFCLGGDPPAWRFSVLFAFSALAGAASLIFLKRIPEVSTPEEVRTSTQAVPWLEIANYRPFKKLLCFNFAWSLAYGGLTAFTVAFMKSEAGMSERDILLVTSVAFLGGLGSLRFLGHRLDHFGSRPVITASLIAWLVIAAGWFVLASGVVRLDVWMLVGLQSTMGMAVSLVNMANTRLAMATIPAMGRNHFFALFSVVSNLTLGLSPVLWGLMIDALRTAHWMWQGMEFNRYSCFFLGVAVAFTAALVLCRRLEEPQAVTMEQLLRDVLIDSPQRVWIRLWPRG